MDMKWGEAGRAAIMGTPFHVPGPRQATTSRGFWKLHGAVGGRGALIAPGFQVVGGNAVR